MGGFVRNLNLSKVCKWRDYAISLHENGVKSGLESYVQFHDLGLSSHPFILVQNPNLGLSSHPFHPGSKKAACSAASLFIPLNPLIHGQGYL